MTIARTVLIHGAYRRQYPYGQVYAAVTGYYSAYRSRTPSGLVGIEQADDRLLAGTRARSGATVYLTISPRAQQAAYAALVAVGKPAAAVAIDPKTGAILALASYPTFDPNLLATLSSRQLVASDRRLINDPAQPLLNRALNATFPPGSTFKIVTSSTGFGTGTLHDQNSRIPAPQFYRLPGSSAVLTNDGQAPCGDGDPRIIYAFTLSCTTAFGRLGDTVGGSALHAYANRYGFNDPSLAVPLPVSPSAFPLLTDPAQIALSAIGQFDDAVTPLQEAMMAAVIANRGTLMRPYLVQDVKAPDQSVLSSASPARTRQAVSPQVASHILQMMISVTHNPAGTAYSTAGPQATGGLDIAGKTGTAQDGVNNSGLDDAVFTCFAPSTNPQIAVGVIIRGGGLGADAAAPIAVKIIRAYLAGH